MPVCRTAVLICKKTPFLWSEALQYFAVPAVLLLVAMRCVSPSRGRWVKRFPLICKLHALTTVSKASCYPVASRPLRCKLGYLDGIQAPRSEEQQDFDQQQGFRNRVQRA
ncbi:hypothetical protein ABBQ38_004818 [Trebouxia sp. C0009 RCD-2024]